MDENFLVRKGFNFYLFLYDHRINFKEVCKLYNKKVENISLFTINRFLKEFEKEGLLKRKKTGKINITEVIFTPKGKKLYLKLKEIKEL